MLNKKGTKTFTENVNVLIEDVTNDELDFSDDTTKAKYDKTQALSAVKILVNDNKELQSKLNEKGELNMDEKDMQLFQNELEKSLDEKFKTKFSGLESDLKKIKESTEKACTSGDCFADKLDDLDKKVEELGKVETSVFDLKLDVNEKLKGVNESISEMTNGFTSSITGMGEKLDNTCTGIECMNKRFAEEDDLVECPNEDCKHMFSLSANTINGTIVCPNCGSISTLD